MNTITICAWHEPKPRPKNGERINFGICPSCVKKHFPSFEQEDPEPVENQQKKDLHQYKNAMSNNLLKAAYAAIPVNPSTTKLLEEISETLKSEREKEKESWIPCINAQGELVIAVCPEDQDPSTFPSPSQLLQIVCKISPVEFLTQWDIENVEGIIPGIKMKSAEEIQWIWEQGKAQMNLLEAKAKHAAVMANKPNANQS